MVEWTLCQYGSVFTDFYGSCEKDLQDAVDECLDYFVGHGNLTGPPYSRHLRDGIFELRASTNKETARFLCFYHPTARRCAVIATAFKKKTRTTPNDQLASAKKIRDAVRRDPGIVDEDTARIDLEIVNEEPVYN